VFFTSADVNGGKFHSSEQINLQEITKAKMIMVGQLPGQQHFSGAGINTHVYKK
jgi:hypothetical protein